MTKEDCTSIETTRTQDDLAAFHSAVTFINRMLTRRSIEGHAITGDQPFGTRVYVDGKGVGSELFKPGDEFAPTAIYPIDGEIRFIFVAPNNGLHKRTIALPTVVVHELFPDFLGEVAEALSKIEYDPNQLVRHSAKFLRGKPMASEMLSEKIKQEILAVYEEDAEQASIEKAHREEIREGWGEF